MADNDRLTLTLSTGGDVVITNTGTATANEVTLADAHARDVVLESVEVEIPESAAVS